MSYLKRKDVPGFLYIMNCAEIQAKERINKRLKNLEQNEISIRLMVEEIRLDQIEAPGQKAIKGLFRLRRLLLTEEPEEEDIRNIHRPTMETLDFVTCFQAGFRGFKFVDVISDNEELIKQKYEGKAKEHSLDFVFRSESKGALNGSHLKNPDTIFWRKGLKTEMENSNLSHIPNALLELFDDLFHSKKYLTHGDTILGFMYKIVRNQLLDTPAKKSKHIKAAVERVVKFETNGKKQTLTVEEKGNFEIRIKTKAKKSSVFIYYTVFSGVALLLTSIESLSSEMLLDQLNLVLGDNWDTSLGLDSNTVTEDKDEDT